MAIGGCQKSRRLEQTHHTMPAHTDAILAVLDRERVALVESGTGSKKSTGLPWAAFGYNQTQVVATQPRRIATKKLASYVAKTRAQQKELGTEIGYIVSGDNKTSSQCKVVYVTEGIALKLPTERLRKTTTTAFCAYACVCVFRCGTTPYVGHSLNHNQSGQYKRCFAAPPAFRGDLISSLL